MIMHLLSRCLKARQQEGAEGPVLMHLSKSWMVTQGAAAGGSSIAAPHQDASQHLPETDMAGLLHLGGTTCPL